MFEKHMKDERCLSPQIDGVMGRDKDYLLSELVNYNKDSVKTRG